MLVTSLCWWLYDGDWFQMLVAESLCWRLSRYVDDSLNVLNRSPTSWIGHQHLKPVTNTLGLQHPSPTLMSPNISTFLAFIRLHLGDIPCRALLSAPDSPEIDEYFDKLDGHFKLESLSNAEFEYGPLYRHTDKERAQRVLNFRKYWHTAISRSEISTYFDIQ